MDDPYGEPTEFDMDLQRERARIIDSGGHECTRGMLRPVERKEPTLHFIRPVSVRSVGTCCETRDTCYKEPLPEYKMTFFKK